MRELHIKMDRFGATTKLTDENGVEIRNVRSLKVSVSAEGFATAELVMTGVHLEATIDGKHVVTLPEPTPCTTLECDGATDCPEGKLCHG